MSHTHHGKEHAAHGHEKGHHQDTHSYQLVSADFARRAKDALEHDYKDQLLRLRAEFDNFRKRQQKEREEYVRFANEGLLSDLLPILDNFELGIKAASSAKDAKDIIQGLEMTLTQLRKFLEESGVTVIDAVGQQFDPHLHEAVGHEISHDVHEGTVLAQHRKGYRLYHRLLRPASVVVAQTPSRS
ncbi:MAG: nucleotide exchange factor GrpE [bacterium]